MIAKTLQGPLTFSTIEPGSGLAAALRRPPADALARIAASGLRGRGGAGFPTSLKWELAAKSPGDRKYVICNADEGEPGTFKDRVILSEFADLVFEGMTIGALVIGARQGIVYLRAEYTYLRPHLEAVLQAPARAEPAGQEHPRRKRASISTSKSAWAPGPTSAAKKRR